MIISPELILVVGLALLVFLFIGYWLGGRFATSRALRQTTESQMATDKQQVQLQQELALIKQSQSQLFTERAARAAEMATLTKQLGDARERETQSGIQVSSLEAKLIAETARTVDKSQQVSVLKQEALNQGNTIQSLQRDISNLRESLGQSLEQVKQLDEAKSAIQRLESTHAQTQETVKQQREQLGQAGEQAKQLEEAKSTILRLESTQAQTQETVKQQREQLGQAGEQAKQLEEAKSTIQRLESTYAQIQEIIKQQREQLGQAGEQAKHLDEARLTILRLESAQAQTQETVKQQREQLGQAGEQVRQLEIATANLKSKDQDLDQARLALSSAKSRVAELEMASQKELEASEEKVRLLQENKEQLTQEFQNLANKIFDAKQQNFSEQSRQGLDLIIKPFKDQLDSFRQRVDQIHTDTVQGQSSMKTELEKLIQLNMQITTEASNLTKALKGDKKLQGTWGEQKVELLLEQAGLRKGIEYERDANFKDDDDRDKRPDFIIQLPDNKHIIVDSKVSLIDYTNYIAAETDEARTVALAGHILALKNHVDGLSGKKYPELKGLNSPDFVFLFMPIEPAYMLAAEHSPALFQAAYEKRIAIVTATTLLPVLRVVANLWSIQRQNNSTKILAEQASKIYSKLRVFVDKMEKLGGQINTVHSSYNDTFKTLHEGKGSLTKIVDGFVELGVKVVERLPSSVTGHDDSDMGGSNPLLISDEGGV